MYIYLYIHISVYMYTHTYFAEFIYCCWYVYMCLEMTFSGWLNNQGTSPRELILHLGAINWLPLALHNSRWGSCNISLLHSGMSARAILKVLFRFLHWCDFTDTHSLLCLGDIICHQAIWSYGCYNLSAPSSVIFFEHIGAVSYMYQLGLTNPPSIFFLLSSCGDI